VSELTPQRVLDRLEGRYDNLQDRVLAEEGRRATAAAEVEQRCSQLEAEIAELRSQLSERLGEAASRLEDIEKRLTALEPDASRAEQLVAAAEELVANASTKLTAIEAGEGGALAQHVAAADPHGDRAYADSKLGG
jgi:TolA-binding protein